MKRVRFFKVVQTIGRSWFSFVIALVALAAFWYFCYWLIATYAPSAIGYFRWSLIVAGCIGGIVLIFNEPIVRISMKCRRVRTRGECPKLWDAVTKAMPKTMIIRPRLYITPDSGMNAFAFGWGIPFFSAVAATQGIVEELSDEELASVMAHEVGHIRNRDILVSTAMSISVMIMALTGYLLLRVAPYTSGGSNRRSSSSSSGKGGGAVILVILAVGFLLYVFGRILGLILQMFVSRQREYAADATASATMGTSQHLQTALARISRNPRLSGDSTNAAFGFLCTADPDPSDFLSTHPAMDKRLRALQALEA